MTHVACPEGKIELPIDVWKCKVTGEVCPIQAHIDTDNWEGFDQHCLAPEERQTGIKQAISTGEYTGFHHLLGRWLCPLCKPSRAGRWNTMYHYEWELYQLERFVPYDFKTLRMELIEHGVSIVAQGGSLCRSCLNNVLVQLDLPPMETQLQKRGYGEPMNEDEPISFQMYRSVIEQASGNEPMEGKCAWCGGGFGWNVEADSVYYDVHSITSPTGDRNGFRLCEPCGERFAALFEVRD